MAVRPIGGGYDPANQSSQGTRQVSQIATTAQSRSGQLYVELDALEEYASALRNIISTYLEGTPGMADQFRAPASATGSGMAVDTAKFGEFDGATSVAGAFSGAIEALENLYNQVESQINALQSVAAKSASTYRQVEADNTGRIRAVHQGQQVTITSSGHYEATEDPAYQTTLQDGATSGLQPSVPTPPSPHATPASSQHTPSGDASSDY